jgi:tetratricopeptide (TPR) repeat protein
VQVAITHDGRSLFVGLDNGRLLAFDNSRQLLWELGVSGPAAALAASGKGARVFAGLADGTVVAVGPDGLALWQAEVFLPVIALATDAAGKWVAALGTDGSNHTLTVLGPEGEVVWEHRLEGKPTGVSLSPNGRYLLVTLASGHASQFEADFSRAAATAPVSRRDRDLAAAREAAERGDLVTAHTRLRELAAQTPHDLEVAEEWLTARNALLAGERQAASELAASGQHAEALARLNAAGELDPWSEGLFQHRREIRQAALESASTCASMCEAQGDWDGAAAAWRDALALDPAAINARRELRRVLERQALALTLAGDTQSQAGDALKAVELWRQAQTLAPTPELEERLRHAEVERCVRAGITYYEEQRLPEAVFQLRKALALEPGHEQAARYLGYAQGQTNNAQVANRFAHLE